MLGSLLISNSSSWLRDVPLVAVRSLASHGRFEVSRSEQNVLYKRRLERSIPRGGSRSIAWEAGPGHAPPREAVQRSSYALGGDKDPDLQLPTFIVSRTPGLAASPPLRATLAPH